MALPTETKAMLGSVQQGTPPSAEHIQSVFKNYCAYLSQGDVQRIVSLFAEDAHFEDPAGSPPRQGLEEIRSFFEQSAGQINLALVENVRISGFVAAASMIAKATKMDPPIQVETLDVMTFNEEGKITSFLAIWGESNVRPL